MSSDLRICRIKFRNRLLTQLLGFGSEKHDDACDALVYFILGVIGDGIEEQKVHYVEV
jgi:hypothetical protein